MEMRAESQPNPHDIVDATKEKALDDAWTFVMRNVEHLVHEVQPDADDELVDRIATGLEQDKITLLMECDNRDQVSMRIRREVRDRLAAEIPGVEKKRKAA